MRVNAMPLCCCGLLCALGVAWLVRGKHELEQRRSPAVVAPAPVRDRATIAPAAIGRIALVPPAKREALPAMHVTPLFQADLRAKLDEPTRLRFALHEPLPSDARLTASVHHGTEPELSVPVKRVDDGGVEVPFTPRGPGRFEIVVSVNGAPVGSGVVGVIGAVGGSDSRTEVDPLTAADPIEYRARTPAVGRLR